MRSFFSIRQDGMSDLSEIAGCFRLAIRCLLLFHRYGPHTKFPTDPLDLHHLYRAMAWLGEELVEDQQHGATPFAPRSLKDVVEEELFKLFARRRDLFSTRVWPPAPPK